MGLTSGLSVSESGGPNSTSALRELQVSKNSLGLGVSPIYGTRPTTVPVLHYNIVFLSFLRRKIKILF